MQGFLGSISLALVCLLAGLGWWATAREPAAATTPAATETMVGPEWDDEGRLLRPDGFERWTLVGTSQGLDYSPGAEKPSAEKPSAEKPSAEAPGTAAGGMFHNVYMQPEAFDHYVRTGEFVERTIFVVTNSPAQQLKGDDAISRRGRFAGKPTGLEVSVMDSSRFDEGWGFFLFHTADGKQTAAKPLPTSACYDCHASHGEDNAVFVQFYSVLKSARERATRTGR